MLAVHSATRICLASLLIFMAAACGGGGDGPTTPPGGGGGGGGGGATATTVTVAAGDGQTAAAGATLPINPAVLVRDAAGKPFAGATVTFSVDSGGGSIASPTATTGSDGIATAGKWTLGSTGPQVLGAVTGGLPRVKLRATLQATGSSLAAQTIAAAGGTITVDRPGSPLTGLTLTVPGGALASATTITLTEVPTAGLTIPAGMTMVSSSALGISASQASLNAPVLVRFPISARPGQVSMVALRNRSTGAVTVLPTVASDGSYITVALSSLDGRGALSTRLTAPAISLSLAGSIADDDPMLFQVAIDPALLERDFDSGFRPGKDDWDFARNPVASLPFLKGGGQAQTTVDPAEGMVASALWYYVNQKGQGGPLNGRFQLASGVPESNRDGIRWTAIATKDVPDIFTAGGIATKWEEQISLDAAAFAAAQFNGIRAMFLLGFERPVPILLFTSDEDLAPRLGIAYRVSGSGVDIVVPDRPGMSYRAVFTPGGMTPFLIVGANEVSYNVRAVAGLHYSMLVKDGLLAAQFSRVAAGTIGNSEGWPSVTLNYEDAQLDTASVFLADTLQHWWECSGCPEYGYRPTTVPPSASHVQQFSFGRIAQDGSVELGERFGSAKLGPEIFGDTVKQVKTGNAIYLPGPGSAGAAAASPGWLGWNTVTYKLMELKPKPSTVEVGGDTTVTFTVSPSPVGPAGTRYAWVFRTDEGRDSVETAGTSHDLVLETGSKGTLLIMALEPTSRRVIGRDSVVITADPAAPYWRIETVFDADGLFEEGDEASGDEAELLRRLLASPKSAMITIEESATGRDINLRVLSSGTWQAAECCPLAPSNPGAMKTLKLGLSPRVDYSVGPFFAGWGFSSWSQTTEELSSGSMTGQYVLGLHTYSVHEAGSQVGPAGAVRFSATRNDRALTGTIEIHMWFFSSETGELYDGPEMFRLPFTATRMQ